MAIVYHDDWKIDKGTKDAKRHQKKIDKAIRDNIADIIGEESIITNKDGKKQVKVPVRGLEDYKFIYGKKGVAGVGQGDKKAGDILDRRSKINDSGKGAGGGGADFMETEVDIDYLLEIMFRDLGLPHLEEKDKASTIVSKGWKMESISKKGVHARVHKKRTMMEAIKRNAVLCGEIMVQTECNEEDAAKALNQAKGDILEAIAIIKEGRLNGGNHAVIINDDDLRFKTIDEDIEICSNAVVIAMMDVSGSMDMNKKYLVRSLLWWVSQFLKTQYEQVQIRFIQHSDDAIEVDEDTFFHRATWGGTYCYTAFEKANDMIDNEYPRDEWNVYCFYCSDGDDFDQIKTVSQIEDMLNKGINMLSYIEVKHQGEVSVLMPTIKKKWKFEEVTKESKTGGFWLNKDLRFYLSSIKDKGAISQCLKFMLNMRKDN
jgi:sporulation protein YhbH